MIIYTDSSFDDKRKIGGIGLYIKDGVKERCISNFIPAPNNNYCEMWAIYIAGILSNGKNATIYTDSQSALAYIENQVKEKPRTQDQYINHQRMMLLAYKIRKLNINVKKVKAHQNKMQIKPIGNNIADLLAKNGRAKFYQK